MEWMGSVRERSNTPLYLYELVVTMSTFKELVHTLFEVKSTMNN